jgi:glycogen debranching enzyme GlgX/4-alpha-glucanotransferase
MSDFGRVEDGFAEPLGASLTSRGVNFAVWSAAAEAVEICLFDEADQEIARVLLPGRTGPAFHGEIIGLAAGARYGLRVHGPHAPERGLFFDHAKLLVDPFALILDRPFAMDRRLLPEAFGEDSAAAVPKALVPDPAALPEPPAPASSRLAADTILYELSVSGFTRGHPGVPEALRGTFAGLAHPAALDHLVALGVTAVELMPSAAWIEERHLAAAGLANAWGYNPVAFLAPDPRLAPGGWAEVRAAVEALAARGIKTILDVVLNHTGEGDVQGPTLSLRGLDNCAAYWTEPVAPGVYRDFAGTGSALALNRAPGLRLAMDTLRAWRRYGGVHGFRFDLATTLGRVSEGFSPEAPLLAAIAQDPELRGLRLIAEPWDCGFDGHRLGAFPSGWGEWNDRYRDALRAFWRGDSVSLGELARRISGSEDIFSGRRPSDSINFIVAHDGFTLADLTAYAVKHNNANGEDNRDGTDHNLSWNHGVEGPTDDPDIQTKRRADQRALLALLLISRGTPMLAMGAESGRTQAGNNNAYAQDNALTWMNWERQDADLLAFTRRLIAIRHAHPALHADRFLTGGPRAGLPVPDVVWTDPAGRPMEPAGWDDPGGATLQMTLAEPGATDIDRICVVIHRAAAPADITLPAPRAGFAWTLLADSTDPARSGPVDQTSLAAAARSVVILAETQDRRRPATAAPVSAEIARLAEAAGISLAWRDALGAERTVSIAALQALLAARGFPTNSRSDLHDGFERLSAEGPRRPLPRAHFVRQGKAARLRLPSLPGRPPPRTGLTLIDEQGVEIRLPPDPAARAYVAVGPDGRRIEGLEVALPPLEAGRYRLVRDDAADLAGHVIAAPDQAWTPEALRGAGRLWGLSAQLYAVRTGADAGLGDFASLAPLLAKSRAAGAQVLAVNPFHALFPADRGRASPYYPSDRRFLDPILIDVGPAPGHASRDSLIDYAKVWAFKRERLDAAYASGDFDAAAFDAFIRNEGAALHRFALFETLAEHFGGPGFTAWPPAWQDPESPECRAFAAAHAEDLRRHQYRQWRAESDLRAAADTAVGMTLGLARDLAVGAAPDGAEAWAEAARLAHGVSLGAPPDMYSDKGQCWGLPPYDPDRLAVDGFAFFGDLLARNMRFAGALRIDHVLGLARQFWIPDGAEAAEGAYVAFPIQGLLSAVALESVRARCLIIGEDLGTVPEGLKSAMQDRAMLGYRVLAFERHGETVTPPDHFPASTWACAATHDLPPLAGWWTGVEIAERFDLGLISAADRDLFLAERAADRQALIAALARERLAPADRDPALPLDDEFLAALHSYLARSPAGVVAVQVEDLAGETTPVNLPGTDVERPNWRRRMGADLETIFASDRARTILAAVTASRS